MAPQNNGQIEPSQPPPELEVLGIPSLLWAEVGSAVMITAWIIQQLVRVVQARADRDGDLLEASERHQAEQAGRLIEILAADQERMHKALTDLRESIDALTNLVGHSKSFNPSDLNSHGDPVVSLPLEPDRRSD